MRPRTATPGVDDNDVVNIVDGRLIVEGFTLKVIDAGGRTLMPGMVEGHCHPSFTGVAAPAPSVVLLECVWLTRPGAAVGTIACENVKPKVEAAPKSMTETP